MGDILARVRVSLGELRSSRSALSDSSTMWKLSEIAIPLSVSYNGRVASVLIWRRQQLPRITQLGTVSSRREERNSCERRNFMSGPNLSYVKLEICSRMETFQ